MKLRQRRGPVGDRGAILPLTTTGDSRASIATNRTRRRRMRSNFFTTGIGCIVFASTLFFLIVVTFRTSILLTTGTTGKKIRNSTRLYTQTKKLGKNSTICPDGSLGIVNDDYCDCLDGSDELSTVACSDILVQKKSFRCLDGFMIYSSRVKDGVYDCPDKSDEE
jgi:Glucosidase II beta subunit-like